MKKRIAILGSTGSIGTQALEVLEKQKNKFEIAVLTANNNSELLIRQAKKYLPNSVVIANKQKYPEVNEALSNQLIKVFAGAESIAQIVELDSIDIVLTAMVGYAGLLPTINAIASGKNIALANKETLVVAGDLITRLAQKHNVSIYPVDSEHSAIFQCLVGEDYNQIEKIILTASGGPFRGKKKDFLKKVKPEQALKHPNWDMGAKITIDSATLMNKGLEVIEAKWLFQLQPEQVEVIIHPQSIIHSIVQFCDGSMKAQMGLPDMKLPIQYALGFPERLSSDFPRFNFLDYPELNFEQPDTENFRNLKIAFDAVHKAGNTPCIMNAANEVVVNAFLKHQIGFTDMPDIIEKVINRISYQQILAYDDYVAFDNEARSISKEIIQKTKI